MWCIIYNCSNIFKRYTENILKQYNGQTLTQWNSSLWPSKQDLTFNLNIKFRFQITKHPNKNIGIQSQYQNLEILAFKPIQCQDSQCKHPNGAKRCCPNYLSNYEDNQWKCEKGPSWIMFHHKYIGGNQHTKTHEVSPPKDDVAQGASQRRNNKHHHLETRCF
jgi:hypothetical protein